MGIAISNVQIIAIKVVMETVLVATMEAVKLLANIPAPTVARTI